MHFPLRARVKITQSIGLSISQRNLSERKIEDVMLRHTIKNISFAFHDDNSAAKLGQILQGKDLRIVVGLDLALDLYLYRLSIPCVIKFHLEVAAHVFQRNESALSSEARLTAQKDGAGREQRGRTCRSIDARKQTQETCGHREQSGQRIGRPDIPGARERSIPAHIPCHVFTNGLVRSASDTDSMAKTPRHQRLILAHVELERDCVERSGHFRYICLCRAEAMCLPPSHYGEVREIAKTETASGSLLRLATLSHSTCVDSFHPALTLYSCKQCMMVLSLSVKEAEMPQATDALAMEVKIPIRAKTDKMIETTIQDAKNIEQSQKPEWLEKNKVQAVLDRALKTQGGIESRLVLSYIQGKGALESLKIGDDILSPLNHKPRNLHTPQYSPLPSNSTDESLVLALASNVLRLYFEEDHSPQPEVQKATGSFRGSTLAQISYWSTVSSISSWLDSHHEDLLTKSSGSGNSVYSLAVERSVKTTGNAGYFEWSFGTGYNSKKFSEVLRSGYVLSDESVANIGRREHSVDHRNIHAASGHDRLSAVKKTPSATPSQDIKSIPTLVFFHSVKRLVRSWKKWVLNRDPIRCLHVVCSWLIMRGIMLKVAALG